MTRNAPEPASASTATTVAAATAAVTRLKLLYLTVFAAYGCTAIYRTLYYRRVGLSNSAVGLMIAVQPLVMLIAGPLWSALADRLNLRSRLLTLVIALSILPIIATAFATRFWPLMLWNVLYAVMQAPMQPLMDSSAVLVLGAQRDRYSVIRAFGSLGYAPIVYLTGVLVQGRDLRWAFVGYAVLMGLATVVSLGIRADEDALSRNTLGGLSAVRKDRAWLTMMAALFVAMILQAATFGYAGLYLDTLGAPESLIGFSGALGSAAQTLLMLTVLPWMVRHWGSERLLVFALGMYALRLAVWAFVATPWTVALTEVLLGVTYGAALVGSVDFAARRAPAGLLTTAQSLMSSLINGLGRTVGSVIAGPLYDGIGPQALFTWFFGLAVAATAAFGVIWRPPSARKLARRRRQS